MQVKKELCLHEEWRGYSIDAACTVLDEGIHVLITGGSRTHVGAVSCAFCGEEVQTFQFPAHRDGAVSEAWAKALCLTFQTPVVVNCGIHYDNVTKCEIMEIMAVTEKLLERVKEALSVRFLTKY